MQLASFSLAEVTYATGDISYLVQEQAKEMARAGGLGLAETIFNALQKGATHG